MSTTIEAVYDNGKFILDKQPFVKKARVLITFFDEENTCAQKKVKFPTKKLGKMKNIDRESIYGDYLSDRY